MGGVALQGESQTRCRVMSWKVFCFFGRQALFPVCFQRRGRRGRKRCCVRPCGKSTWAAAEEPRRDESRAKSFKTFSRFVFPITSEQQKSDSSEVSWPSETQKNWLGCLILSCRLRAAGHCLAEAFRPLGFPPFQDSSSADDNTPRQAV